MPCGASRLTMHSPIAGGRACHALWVNQFGTDPAIMNRTIVLDNEPYTVVGIMPTGSAFDRDFFQFWRPLAFKPSEMTRDYHWLGSFARLKSGVSLQQAQANTTAIGSRLEREFPDSNKGWGVTVERDADTLVGQDLRTALLVLLTATGLVLLMLLYGVGARDPATMVLVGVLLTGCGAGRMLCAGVASDQSRSDDRAPHRIAQPKGAHRRVTAAVNGSKILV